MRGKVAEIEIGGKTRGFKFGTYQMAVTSEECKCDLVELHDRLKNPAANLITLLNFIYGAAVAYCKSKKIEVDFTAADVSDWLDEIGISKAMELINEGLSTPNEKAPQPEGQQSSITP